MKRFVSTLLVMVMCLVLASPSAAYSATIKLNKSKLTLNVGEKYTLKVTGTTKTPKWTSSKKSVATVSSKGKITAVAKGTTTITATISQKKYKCNLTVKDQNVEVIFSAYMTDDVSIEEYIKEIEDPGFISIRVYDDTHYAVTMPESYRRSMIKQYENEIEPQIKLILSDPTYKAMLTDIKYNKLVSEITIYSDLSAIDELSALTYVFVFSMLSDIYQAINLVDIEDRYLKIKVINNTTKKEIYSYDSRIE